MARRPLPAGWNEVALSDVAEVRLGRQRSPKNHLGTHMRPYLRAANVTWSGLDLVDVKEMNFDPREAEVFALEPGDVLISEASGSIGEAGKPAIWHGEIPGCCFQNTLIRIRPSMQVATTFLYHLLYYQATSGGWAAGIARGVGIHHLGAQRVAAWRFGLPPVNEQYRLAAELDRRFSRIDAGIRNLGEAEQRLSHLRDAVLARVGAGHLDGRLEDWTPETLVGDSGLPAGWHWVTLGEVARTVKNGLFVSRPGLEPDGLPILRIGAVRPMCLNHMDIRYSGLSPDDRSVDAYRLQEGHLLFTRYNGTREFVGACAVVRTPAVGLLHPDKLIRVELDTERALPDYVEAVLSSPQARSQFERLMKTTSGQTGISGSDLKKVRFPLPPLDEQERIAADAERWMAKIARVESTVEVIRQRSDTLRRTLLASAFSGTLIASQSADTSDMEVDSSIGATA